jgi:hypothetical protein
MLLSDSDFGSDPTMVNVAYIATTNGKEGSLLCFLIEVVCFLIEVSAQLTAVSPPNRAGFVGFGRPATRGEKHYG